MSSGLYEEVARAVQAAERWARSSGLEDPAHVAPLESTPSAAPRLDASEIAAAEESTTLLRRAQIILATLTAVLRPRYDEFIGMTAVRGAWEFLRRRKRLPLKTAPRIFCLESESLASTLP